MGVLLRFQADVSGVLVAPETFNTGRGLKNTILLALGGFLINGILSAFLYLRASPLPAPAGIEGSVAPLKAIETLHD